MGSTFHLQPVVCLAVLLSMLVGIAIVVLATRIPAAPELRDPALSPGKRAILLATVAISLMVCLLAAALAAGYHNSPDDLRDSNGHALGFNEPLTWELARMVLSNSTASSIVDALGWYGCLLVALHLLAIAFFTGALRARPAVAARVCWLQFVVFPLGWIGLWLLYAIAERGIDGEDLTDFPFWWTSQPLWLFVAALAGWWLQRASAGQRLRRRDNGV